MKNQKKDTKLLVRNIAMGDEVAFRRFFDLYYLDVYRFSSYFVKSTQAIEEIVSDVFCVIWQNRKRIVKIENFEGYLYTITKNKALRYHKFENKTISTETDFIHNNSLFHNETPEYLAIDKELSMALKGAVDKLPERCRLIFLMAREEKLKYKEIAQILSISEKTVNAQMVLAIKKLTKQLGNILFFIL